MYSSYNIVSKELAIISMAAFVRNMDWLILIDRRNGANKRSNFKPLSDKLVAAFIDNIPKQRKLLGDRANNFAMMSSNGQCPE